MKIGILTFHQAQNYGAVLQAYGLQEFLRGLGHETYILDYKPKYLIVPYKVFKFQWSNKQPLKHNLFYSLRHLLTAPIRLKRKIAFKEFIHKYLNIHEFNINHNLTGFDAIIFGSDQIWNEYITNNDPVFWGQFHAAKNKKLIAYAASIGSIQNIKSQTTGYFSKLKSFQSISVREKSFGVFLKEIFPNIEVEITLDPVLLAGREVFDKITKPSTIKAPYLLLFQLYSNDYVKNIAKNIAEQKGLILIEVLSSFESLKNKNCLTAESPQNFLSLFKGANYVVTSSFHGTAFSILFEKDFNTISVDPSISERMSDLLSILNLQDRLLKYDEAQIYPQSIDYKSVNDKLNELRSQSKSFLENALT